MLLTCFSFERWFLMQSLSCLIIDNDNVGHWFVYFGCANIDLLLLPQLIFNFDSVENFQKVSQFYTFVRTKVLLATKTNDDVKCIGTHVKVSNMFLYYFYGEFLVGWDIFSCHKGLIWCFCSHQNMPAFVVFEKSMLLHSK